MIVGRVRIVTRTKESVNRMCCEAMLSTFNDEASKGSISEDAASPDRRSNEKRFNETNDEHARSSDTFLRGRNHQAVSMIQLGEVGRFFYQLGFLASIDARLSVAFRSRWVKTGAALETSGNFASGPRDCRLRLNAASSI